MPQLWPHRSLAARVLARIWVPIVLVYRQRPARQRSGGL